MDQPTPMAQLSERKSCRLPKPWRSSSICATTARRRSLPTACSISCTRGMSGIFRTRGAKATHSIVGVNSDRSVRAIKGPARPINPEHERAELLAALACVDAVVVFDEDNPHQIISRLQPGRARQGCRLGSRRHHRARRRRIAWRPRRADRARRGLLDVCDNRKDTGYVGRVLRTRRAGS